MRSLLIVDDQTEVRAKIREMLSRMGMLPDEIEEASNVADAVSIASAYRPDAMLLDVVLPDGSGFDVLRALTERGIDCKAVMMTAFPQFDYALEAANSKAAGFLVKPIQEAELTRMLLQLDGAEDAQRHHALALTMLDVYLKGQQFNMRVDEMREMTGINRLKGRYYLVMTVSVPRSLSLETQILRFWSLLRELRLENVNYLQDTATLVLILRSDDPEKIIPGIRHALGEAFDSFYGGFSASPYLDGLRHAYQMAVFARDYASDNGLENYLQAYETLDIAEAILGKYREGLLQHDLGAAEEMVIEATRNNLAPETLAEKLHAFLRQEENVDVTLSAESLRAVGKSLLAFWNRPQRELTEEEVKNQWWMRHIKLYIAGHYMENITRSDIAEAVGLSYSYVGELFRENTGHSITDYVQNLKMDKARELLSGTQLNLQEIAKRIGYPDSNGFIRAFQNRWGITPGEWRRREKTK